MSIVGTKGLTEAMRERDAKASVSVTREEYRKLHDDLALKDSVIRYLFKELGRDEVRVPIDNLELANRWAMHFDIDTTYSTEPPELVIRKWGGFGFSQPAQKKKRRKK